MPVLDKGHEVVVLDLFIYGEEVLDDHERSCVKGDIRDLDVVGAALEGCVTWLFTSLVFPMTQALS